MNKISISIFLLSCLLLAGISVFANGIPVMFAVSVLHIIIINSVVMIIETQILKSFSKSRVISGFIILANLTSLFLLMTLPTNHAKYYIPPDV